MVSVSTHSVGPFMSCYQVFLLFFPSPFNKARLNICKAFVYCYLQLPEWPNSWNNFPLLIVCSFSITWSIKSTSCFLILSLSFTFLFLGTLTSMTFAVGIALFGALGYLIQPWRSLAIAANSSGVLFFLLSVWVPSKTRLIIKRLIKNPEQVDVALLFALGY